MRQIAAEIGVGVATVDRVVNGVPKGKPSKAEQPIEADPDDPRQIDIEDVLAAEPPVSPVRAALAELQDPQFVAWHKVLEALRTVNALTPVDRLFGDRRRSFDHAIGPELARARAWLNAFEEEYSHE
jgi:hypothetical protein